MLSKEIITVYSEGYTKPINTLHDKMHSCSVTKAGGTQSYQWA
jgi:hypothetical protein